METLQTEESNIDLEWDDGHVLPEKVYPDVAFLFQKMNEITVGKVAISGGEMVLDIGCGRAIEATELAKRGGKCLGLEPSRKMINYAQKYITDNDMEVTLIQGAGEYLPFKTASIDKILCKGALDHFLSPSKAVEEMVRVLKPRGKAIIAIANFESLGFRLGRCLFSLEKFFVRGKIKHQNIWQIPDDHTFKFDYAVLKRLVKPHLKIEHSTGILALTGLPGWSSLLDKLPKSVSLAVLSTLDSLARYLPWLGDVIIIRCSLKS
ncbi:MAG: type 11 methyltransferase [bacterium]|nr:MAG: type 11 methyltransferase [bacterium]